MKKILELLYKLINGDYFINYGIIKIIKDYNYTLFDVIMLCDLKDESLHIELNHKANYKIVAMLNHIRLISIISSVTQGMFIFFFAYGFSFDAIPSLLFGLLMGIGSYARLNSFAFKQLKILRKCFESTDGSADVSLQCFNEKIN